MKRIGLIACSCSKQGKNEPERKFKAKDIYTGNTFCISKNIGLKRFNCDDWHILSAKYNLLDKDDEITYYDVYLAKQKPDYKKAWINSVITKLKEKYDLENDVFIFLVAVIIIKVYYLIYTVSCLITKIVILSTLIK